MCIKRNKTSKYIFSKCVIFFYIEDKERHIISNQQKPIMYCSNFDKEKLNKHNTDRQVLLKIQNRSKTYIPLSRLRLAILLR